MGRSYDVRDVYGGKIGELRDGGSLGADRYDVVNAYGGKIGELRSAPTVDSGGLTVLFLVVAFVVFGSLLLPFLLPGWLFGRRLSVARLLPIGGMLSLVATGVLFARWPLSEMPADTAYLMIGLLEAAFLFVCVSNASAPLYVPIGFALWCYGLVIYSDFLLSWFINGLDSWADGSRGVVISMIIPVVLLKTVMLVVATRAFRTIPVWLTAPVALVVATACASVAYLVFGGPVVRGVYIHLPVLAFAEGAYALIRIGTAAILWYGLGVLAVWPAIAALPRLRQHVPQW